MSNSKILLASFAVAAYAAGPAIVPAEFTSDQKLLPGYVSLSYELAGFPAFSGTKSSPNQYSVNLLQNIAKYQGEMPRARVGGNSQDRAIYDATLQTPTASRCSADPLAIQCIGPSFFDSYGAFPSTKYSHGFNEAWNNASGLATLEATVPLACKAIGPDQLETWEFGNEPDLFIGKWRPNSWNEAQYVAEWQNGTDKIFELMQQHCPELATPEKFNFMAPSVSSPGSRLKPVTIFNDGEDTKNIVKQISVHNYITGVNSPGVTLQNSLMNHVSTVNSINNHVRTAQSLATIPGLENVPYIQGEQNSLYGGGRPGLSNVYGSALWALDYILQAASTGIIKRLHFHQSLGASYSAWYPVGVNSTTNPSYYGKLAAAVFMGKSDERYVLPLPEAVNSSFESAYAGYDAKTGRLNRLAIINMNEFNSTQPANTRESKTYEFKVPSSTWKVERLTAPGADVTTGVTFGGYAYEYTTLGKPKAVVYRSEVLAVAGARTLKVKVPASEAAILTRL